MFLSLTITFMGCVGYMAYQEKYSPEWQAEKKEFQEQKRKLFKRVSEGFVYTRDEDIAPKSTGRVNDSSEKSDR